MTEDEVINSIADTMDLSLSKLWERVKDRESWHGTPTSPWGLKELDTT